MLYYKFSKEPVNTIKLYRIFKKDMRGLLFHSCVKLTCDPSCVLHESSPLHYFQNVQHFVVQHASSPIGQPHDTDIISTRIPLLQLACWMTSQTFPFLWKFFNIEHIVTFCYVSKEVLPAKQHIR